MSLERDVARLGATIEELTPEERDGVLGGVVELSALMARILPTVGGIAQRIANVIRPELGARLGRDLRDVGMTVAIRFVGALVSGNPDAAGQKVVGRLAAAIAVLPIATSGLYLQPILSPWRREEG